MPQVFDFIDLAAFQAVTKAGTEPLRYQIGRNLYAKHPDALGNDKPCSLPTNEWPLYIDIIDHPEWLLEWL